MTRRQITFSAAALLLILFISLTPQGRIVASGIAQAVIPQAVPTANKIGNSTKFQLGTTGAVSGDCASFDANLNVVGAGTGVPCGTGAGGVTSIFGQTGAVQLFNPNPQTSTYQALAADFNSCKVINVASGTFTVTLVASGTQPAAGKCIYVLNFGAGVVTIARSGQNINGGTASLTLAAASAAAPTGAFVVSDGTDYFAQTFGSASGSIAASGYYLNSGTNYYVGPTFTLATLPVAGNFAWQNQGTATETATGNALLLTTAAAARSWTSRVSSIGAATTLTAAFMPTLEPQDFRVSAILFRESATGKLVTFGFVRGYGYQITRWTNDTTFGAQISASSPANSQLYPPIIWVRLVIAGTNLEYYWSSDGTNFVKVFTGAKTASFTTAPDQWGYGTNCETQVAGQSSPCYNLLLSWATQ